MPVGTRGAVKGITFRDVRDAGAEIVSATPTISLRPGDRLIARAGGLHAFIGWPHPILTDSGDIRSSAWRRCGRSPRTAWNSARTWTGPCAGCRRKAPPTSRPPRLRHRRWSSMSWVGERGARFGGARSRSPDLRFPASASRLPALAPRDGAVGPWARRCRRCAGCSSFASTLAVAAGVAGHQPGDRRSFGIIQGGVGPPRCGTESCPRRLGRDRVRGLRDWRVELWADPWMSCTTSSATPLRSCRAGRPRYLMGTGMPDDLVECWPAGRRHVRTASSRRRNARNGQLLTRHGVIVIKNARYAEDRQPPDPACGCYTCRHLQPRLFAPPFHGRRNDGRHPPDRP
jgi:queuine tRNA-ribosyltransferase